MKPMKKIDTYIYKLGLWAGAALSLTACVDEDLSDFPQRTGTVLLPQGRAVKYGTCY